MSASTSSAYRWLRGTWLQFGLVHDIATANYIVYIVYFFSFTDGDDGYYY